MMMIIVRRKTNYSSRIYNYLVHLLHSYSFLISVQSSQEDKAGESDGIKNTLLEEKLHFLSTLRTRTSHKNLVMLSQINCRKNTIATCAFCSTTSTTTATQAEVFSLPLAIRETIEANNNLLGKVKAQM
jgi:hypothetical protein